MPRGGKRPGAGRKTKLEKRRAAPRRAGKPAPVVMRRAPAKPAVARALVADAPFPLQIIDGGSGEPDWSQIFTDELDLACARKWWAILVRELRDNEKFAESNGHQIERTVISYVFYEQIVRKVAEEGAVLPAKGKRHAKPNPWFDALKGANAMASSAEAELTISPRRRNNGGKIQRKVKRVTASDEFLKVVPIRPGNPMGKTGG